MSKVGVFNGRDAIAGNYNSIAAKHNGELILSSKNRFFDSSFRQYDVNDKLEDMVLGAPPAPDGWGIYVKGGGIKYFSEQNLEPHSLSDTSYVDIINAVIDGPSPPDNVIPISKPDTPRARIRVTGVKGYLAGWYTLTYAFIYGGGLRRSANLTMPAPRSEAFQLNQGNGVQFTLPETIPAEATGIVIYLSTPGTTAVQAGNNPLWEQRRINIEPRMDTTYFLRGPFKRRRRDLLKDGTKLKPYMANLRVWVRRTPGVKMKNIGYVQFGYTLYDKDGKESTLGGHTEWKEYNWQGNEAGISFRPRRFPRGATHWKPYVRFKTVGDSEVKISQWSSFGHRVNNKYKLSKSEYPTLWSGDNTGPIGGWPKLYKFRLSGGQPPGSDATGMERPETAIELPTALDLNSSALALGKYHVKTSLYYGDFDESATSSAQRVDINTLGEFIRINRPSYQNRFENPEVVEREASDPTKPINWQIHLTGKVFPTPGKMRISDLDNLSTDTDLITTPDGILDDNASSHVLTFDLNVGKYLSGSIQVFLDEYKEDSTSNGSVKLTTITTGGQHTVTQRITRNESSTTTGRSSKNGVRVKNNTKLVKVRLRATGTRNYEATLKNLGLFAGGGLPRKRWSDSPVSSRQRAERSYPHGGYCHVIEAYRGVSGGSISIPASSVFTDDTSARTVELKFITGSDITTRQVLYREGDNNRGYNVIVVGGLLYLQMWDVSNRYWHSITIEADTTYTATLVHDGSQFGNKFAGYLDGALVGSKEGVAQLTSRSGAASVCGNTGSTLDESGAVLNSAAAFTGEMHFLRVWDRAFDDSEVPSDVVEELDESIEHMQLQYAFKEQSGATAHDDSRNRLHGTLGSGAAFLHNYGAYEDNTNLLGEDNFNAGTSGAFSTGGTATFSISDSHSISESREKGGSVAGSGTQSGYFTRTLSSAATTTAAGMKVKLTDAVDSGTHDIISLRSGSTILANLRISSTGAMTLVAGASSVSAGVLGLDAATYLELVGTANSVTLLRGNSWDDTKAVATLTGLTQGTYDNVRLGPQDNGGTPTGTWEYKIGELRNTQLGSRNIARLNTNYIEYYGPQGTPMSDAYGPHGRKMPVEPNETVTFSVYAAAQEQAPNTKLFYMTAYDEDDNVLRRFGPVVNWTDDSWKPWKRHSLTMTMPPNADYLEIEKNRVGEGTIQVQAPQLESGPTATTYDNTYASSGWVEVVEPALTRGRSRTNDSLGSIGLPKRLLDTWIASTSYEYEDRVDPTSASVSVASGPTENGPWTGFETNLANLAPDDYYKIRLDMSTSDPLLTPEVDGFGINIERHHGVLLDSEGREYYGGVLVRQVPPISNRRVIEELEYDDGGKGFLEWSDPDNPPQWIEGFSIECYTKKAYEAITYDVGRGDGTFIMEYYGQRYTLRILAINFEHNMNRGDGGELYVFTANDIVAEVLYRGDLV